jgi:hypothetical protein
MSVEAISPLSISETIQLLKPWQVIKDTLDIQDRAGSTVQPEPAF